MSFLRRSALHVAAILAVALFSAAAAQAGTLTFTDYADWVAAVSGVTTVTIPEPVNNATTGYDNFPPGGSVTYFGVVFSANLALGEENFFNVGTGFLGLPPVLSAQGASTGVENILISLPGFVTGFALNYGTFGGSSVTFLLSNGDSVTQGSSTGSGYSVPDFFGVTDGTAFNSVLVTSPDVTGLNLNGVSYSGVSSNGVPEPAAWLLLSGGLAGLLVHGRRRSKSA